MSDDESTDDTKTDSPDVALGAPSGRHADASEADSSTPEQAAEAGPVSLTKRDKARHAAEPETSTPETSTPETSTPDAAVGPDVAAATADADTDADDTDADDTDAVPPPGETRRRRRKRLKAQHPKRKAPWWELPALVLLAIGIAILVKSFVVQPFYIPSESMEKTLHGCTGCRGDRILVNKPIYTVLRDPEPGDIVVFDAPDGWNGEATSKPPSNPVVRVVRGFGQLVGVVAPDGEVLVKRVIATGGQTVKGDSQGHVMISTHGADGPYRLLHEPYVYAPKGDLNTQPNFGPVTVPKGRLWVMGDHRAHSADSRYHCTPNGPEGTDNDTNCDPNSSTVPIDKVIGKAFVIAWPPSRWDILGSPSTFDSAASAASAPTLPAVASLSVVAPVLLIRRRRRRRRRPTR